MTQEFTEQLAKWEMHLHQLGYRKVVLCKDCKKYFPKTADRDSYCPFVGRIGLEPEGYCAWAERRTDND